MSEVAILKPFTPEHISEFRKMHLKALNHEVGGHVMREGSWAPDPYAVGPDAGKAGRPLSAEESALITNGLPAEPKRIDCTLYAFPQGSRPHSVKFFDEQGNEISQESMGQLVHVGMQFNWGDLDLNWDDMQARHVRPAIVPLINWLKNHRPGKIEDPLEKSK